MDFTEIKGTHISDTLCIEMRRRKWYVLFLDFTDTTSYILHVPTREVSKYEKIMRQEYAKFSYGTNVSTAISNEVKGCRENVALFDLSSFGKVLYVFCSLGAAQAQDN